MSEVISQAKASIWEWRVAIMYFILFSINSLSTVLLATLTGVNWTALPTQGKVMIVIAVIANWTGTIMAFVSQQAKRIKKTGDIFSSGDTQVFTKQSPSQSSDEATNK